MKVLSANFKLNTFLIENKSKISPFGYKDTAIFSPKTDKNQLLCNKEIKQIVKVATCELFTQRMLETIGNFS